MTNSKLTTFAFLLSAAVGLSGSYSAANAQSTYADKALSQLAGSWIGSNGRAITFQIRDGNAIFSDEVEPAVTLTGAYRQDDAGAGYVLRYTQGFDCRYNVTAVGVDGTEMNFRLVTSSGPENPRFHCLQGPFKRVRAR
jgi:opacity protein-like surface antigen